MGYTDKDITEGADRQSEDEFVMEKYNAIMEARLDQKQQQDQLNDQTANPDKYDEFDRIEEVDLLANDLQDYDALEEDALRQALREDYQRERDIVVWVMNTVINNLRCLVCFEHGTSYLQDNWRPEYARSQEDLFRFLYNFHVAANKHADKISPSYEEVKRFYYENNERCKVDTCSTGGNNKVIKEYID